VSSEISD